MKRRIFRALFCLICLCIFVGSAFASDTVKLKNGKVYTGEIVSQTPDLVKFKTHIGGIEYTYTFWRDDIASITTDDAGGKGKTATDTGAAAAATSSSSSAATPSIDQQKSDDAAKKADDPTLKNKKVFVIPLEGEVGKTMRADKLQECFDAARPFKPDVVVLEVDSPGGALSEIYKLRDVIQKERDEFRVVAWIKSAISAAAMTSLNCREIYFRKEGQMGAATAWYQTNSGAKAVTGPELDRFIEDMKKMGASAGYSPYVVQAMIKKEFALSATRTVLPDGEVKVEWFDSATGGQELVCKSGEILTLTATPALRYKISLGTVDNEQEFAKLLNLDGWVEVSDAGRKIMKEWKDTCDQFDIDVPRLYQEWSGPATTNADRIRIVQEFRKWCRRAPQLTDGYAMPDGSGGQLNDRNLERLLKVLLRNRN